MFGESGAVIPGSQLHGAGCSGQLQGWALTASFGEVGFSTANSGRLCLSPPPSRPLDPPPSPYHPRPAPAVWRWAVTAPSPSLFHSQRCPRPRACATGQRDGLSPEVRASGPGRIGQAARVVLRIWAPKEAWLWQWLCCVALGKSLSVSGPLPPQPENRIGFLATQAFLRSPNYPTPPPNPGGFCSSASTRLNNKGPSEGANELGLPIAKFPRAPDSARPAGARAGRRWR